MQERGDLLVALNHLENKITAEEAITKPNESAKDKRRSGYIREAGIQYTRLEGT
jgi:hypothetical protein